MKIIISPAKKMKVDDDSLAYKSLPVFLKDSEKIIQYIKSLSFEETKKLWAANDKITNQNIERFKTMDLKKGLTPAIFSYEGIQYQYISPSSLEEKMLDYIQENLRILSGFYGVIKPMDGVVPYRLEMQAKTEIGDINGLYDFWGKKLYNEVIDDSKIIINLASKEYSKCIEKYLHSEDEFITCSFLESSNGKLVQKGTYAKMARGDMVRFMAENNIQKSSEIKNYSGFGYEFDEKISKNNEYVFVKKFDLK